MATDNLPIGQKFKSRFGRTISEGDFALLTSMTWLHTPLFCDAEYMKSTPYGERILPGPCVLAVLIGLGHQSGFHQSLVEAGFRGLGLIGFESVRFLSPVKPGDTLYS